MKKLITIIGVFFIQNCFATTYYVDPGGNDANAGTSAEQPWQTLNKVNSFSFSAGDVVLLKRGSIFHGNIISATKGTVGKPVIYGDYGADSDPNPIISGFTSVTSWVNKGSNIWESTNAVSTLSSMNMVLINGKSTPMGRYPNGDASYPFLPNFYKFQSITGDGSGASSITSSSLGATDWTNAEVVIRVNQWTYHRELITSQSGSTLNFTGAGAGGLTAGWGFFIQNDIRTLDQQGEWYYNPSTKKISIYSTSTPTDVQVSTIDTLFYFHSNAAAVSYANIANINFIGANTNGIFVNGNLSFSLINCDVFYSGFEGIVLFGGGVISRIISRSAFYGNGSSGIFTTGDVQGLVITNNTVKVSGIISAYKRDDYTNGGINCNAPGSLIKFNTVDSSAYCGINFKGSGIHVENNLVNHSAMIRGDAAGIYTGFANETGKTIDSNIVLNSMGNTRGAGSDDYFAMGIYIDDKGTGIEIKNNTVVNARTGGIYFHNSNNLKVSNNTVYNCGSLNGESMWANGGVSMDANASFAGDVHDNVFTNNIIFAITPYQYALNFYAESGSDGDVSKFGTIDSNYYVKINDDSKVIMSNQKDINGEMSLITWQSLSGKDAHSHGAPTTIKSADDVRLEYNATISPVTISLGDSAYMDAKGKIYSGSITLEPFASAVLIYFSTGGVIPPSPYDKPENSIKIAGQVQGKNL